ncbi:MAG: COX15/CtaA family protein [Kyrpidia sp.]|nr:COX15/CtaA family protein [Kyrpidia sp.]
MGYRLPLVTAIAIYISMIMGALVVGLNAGFVCPDWPLCNGKLIPPLDGLVLVEYTHRLVAAAVSILVFAVAITGFLRRKRLDRLSKWLVGMTVVTIALQVIVGALIVVLVLPGAFTTIDVGNSMLLLGTMVALAVHRRRLASGGSNAEERPGAKDRGLMRAAWASAGATFAQAVFGGYFRHSGAGEALFDKGTYLASHQQFVLPSKVFSAAVFAGHIIFGILVMACAVWLLAEAVRRHRRIKAVVVFLAILLADMAAGALSFVLQLNLAAVTVHWAGAALAVAWASYLVSSVWHDARYRAAGTEPDAEVNQGSPVAAGGRI